MPNVGLHQTTAQSSYKVINTVSTEPRPGLLQSDHYNQDLRLSIKPHKPVGKLCSTVQLAFT